MNDPRFEVFPQSDPNRGSTDAGMDREFYWRFRDANGRITFIGGEGFTRREDAHRAVRGACADVIGLYLGADVETIRRTFDAHGSPDKPPIVDVDE